MKRPLISIITVNLNNFTGLKKTIKGVFEQTWKDFEFIVIDGGSNDGSKEFIESQNDKITYWVSEPDTGVYNGMNKGIVASRGEYLLFLNSGDYFYDEFVLEKINPTVKEEDLIYFNVKIRGNSNNTVSYPPQLRFSDLRYGTICHQAVFIKRKLFEKVGPYDESLKIVSDWKFFILALFKYNCSYRGVNKILTIYDTEGISAAESSKAVIAAERNEVLNKHFRALLHDFNELEKCRSAIQDLRNSRKIKLLTKLGLIKPF
jgi:glycosyltransferase involved in cell wall biosynthesis